MNFFKKALVASAVVASFGAAADATVSSAALELSQEGIAAGNTALLQGLTFDVVVGTDTPASSKITLTFDNTIDLNGLAGGSVVNTNSGTTGTGQGVIDNGGAGDITFDYGTGSFTFDNVEVDDNDQTAGEKDSITFQVNLGNSLTAGSAFRLTLGVPAAGLTPASGLTTIAGAANLAYQSTNADGSVVIEDGTGTVAKETAQFGVAVTTQLDSLINRDTTSQFINAVSPAFGTDTLVLTYSNNEALAASLTSVDVVTTLKGNFSGLDDAEFATVTAEVAPATAPATPLAAGGVVVSGTAGAEDTLTLTLLAANTSLDGSTTATVTYTATGAKVLPATGEIEATVVVNTTNDATAAVPLTLATNAAAGEWAIDATIINVPYFPVGYDGVQSTIQLANEGTAIVDVIVTANDKMGNQYGPVNLKTLPAYSTGLPAQAVSKVSDVDIMDLLSAPAESSLSITFNVDANEGVVNGYAYTQKAGTGRTEVSTSQQRGN